MPRTSKTTRVPLAQPITAMSIRQNLPLSQTKPVRATEWKIPRFNPVAPSVRVQSAGQHHVSSAVNPAFHVWSCRLLDFSCQTQLSRCVVFGRNSEEKIPDGISAGDGHGCRRGTRSTSFPQATSNRYVQPISGPLVSRRVQGKTVQIGASDYCGDQAEAAAAGVFTTETPVPGKATGSAANGRSGSRALLSCVPYAIAIPSPSLASPHPPACPTCMLTRLTLPGAQPPEPNRTAPHRTEPNEPNRTEFDRTSYRTAPYRTIPSYRAVSFPRPPS